MILIGVFNRQKHILFDVLRDFLKLSTTEDKMVVLKFKEKFVDLICQIKPKHVKIVVYEVGIKGKKQKL